MSMVRGLAVVPARGGSKRLERKNLREIDGKPLICYTLEACLDSGCFSEIILSSDDEDILEIGGGYDGVTCEKRVEALSGDRVKAREIVWDIIDRPGVADKFDVVSLLLPTAPFRKAEDIKAGFEMLTPDIDSVVSMTLYEFPPQMGAYLDEDNIIKPVFDDSPLVTGETRSQDMKTIYRPNGGFYISWMKKFRENRIFFKGKVKGYVMPRVASIDIDEQLDLLYAQFLASKGLFTLEDAEK